MSFLERLVCLFEGDKVTESDVSVPATADWHGYRAGEGDRAGRKITNLYAVDDDYVIYFIGSDLYYEITPGLEKALGNELAKADAALARINRLLDANPTKGSREYKNNVLILELAGDALEMFFCGEKTEALEILNSLRDKLQAREEGQRRLMYQVGTVVITTLPWILYLALHGKGYQAGVWNPWMLAAALAMAGGLFSVCLSIGSLEVNLNQPHWFLFRAGATRSVVALLAGVGLLLAMRSKMFAGITYDNSKPPPIGAALIAAEMFFCFLAGFSEYFVPNILSKTTDKKNSDGKNGEKKKTDGKNGDE